MRLAGLLLRMLCVLALIGSSWPVSASEAVCVMPNQRVVPMATCGMPCCVQKEAKTLCTMPNPTASFACCAGKKVHSARFGKGDCRCEVRTKATTVAPATAPSVGKAPLTSLAPAILTEVDILVAPVGIVWSESGIVGTDSGPPPQTDRTCPPGRAPPACAFSSEA